MPTLSFMTANYVARQLGYHMTAGWMEGDQATQDYFRPLATFARRFDDLLAEIRGLEFDAIDLWLAHLHPSWATPDHIAIANDLLARHHLAVISLAGWFGGSRAEFEAVCRMATALGASMLGGNTGLLGNDRAWLVSTLRHYGLKLGLENHPEKTPAELLAKIGKGDADVIGVAIDTGWFGTQGYDAAQAIRALAPVLAHVHLKDVLAAGAHDTCRLGAGVVPVRECVQTLLDLGYAGGISIEHEPEHFNPNDDVRASLLLVQSWLA